MKHKPYGKLKGHIALDYINSRSEERKSIFQLVGDTPFSLAHVTIEDGKVVSSSFVTHLSTRKRAVLRLALRHIKNHKPLTF